MPISWFACVRPESIFDFTRISALTISELPTAIPTRQDGQAKSLGEWLRARVVDLPVALLP